MTRSWATPSLPPRVFHTLSSAESALHWHRDCGNDRDTPPDLTHRGGERLTRHLYGRLTRDGEIIFGGDRQLVGYEKVPDAAGIEANRRHAAEVLPFLMVSGVGPSGFGRGPMAGKLLEA